MLYYITALQVFLRKPLERDKGATAVEYGLMIAAVVAIIVVLAFTLGQYVFDAFTDANQGWEDGVTLRDGGGEAPPAP